MTRGLARVVSYWSTPIRAERMAAFRIVIGALVATDTAITILPHAAWYLGADGLHPEALFRLVAGPGTWSLVPADATATEARAYVLALVAASVGVACGLATRLSSIAMWALLVSIHHRSPYVLNGGDFLLQVAALYLVLMPAGRAWSVDAALRRRRGREASPWVLPWPYRLAQIQLAVMYLFTGLSKLPTPDGPHAGQWISGQALAGALGAATMARFEILSTIPWWVSAPAVWATLAWEISFPVLLLFRRTRALALAFGVLLHLAIFATLEVGVFSFASLSYYVLFLPPAWFGPAEPRREPGDPR